MQVLEHKSGSSKTHKHCPIECKDLITCILGPKFDCLVAN